MWGGRTRHVTADLSPAPHLLTAVNIALPTVTAVASTQCLCRCRALYWAWTRSIISRKQSASWVNTGELRSNQTKWVPGWLSHLLGKSQHSDSTTFYTRFFEITSSWCCSKALRIVCQCLYHILTTVSEDKTKRIEKVALHMSTLDLHKTQGNQSLTTQPLFGTVCKEN